MTDQNDVIKDIYSLVTIVERVNKDFTGQIWWRGHRCYNDWKLEPAVFREARNNNPQIFKRNLQIYERNIIERFRLLAKVRHQDLPNDDNLSDWLVLMQHYGLPTRLLDWTESPLIALFFAIFQIDGLDYSNKDGALYALSPRKLNEFQGFKTHFFSMRDQKIQKLLYDVYYSKRKTRSLTKDAIYAVRPEQYFPRMMMQLSAFTLHSTETPLDEINGYEGCVRKYRIPAEAKRKENLPEQLKHLGIREYNTYPDLDHLSHEIKELRS